MNKNKIFSLISIMLLLCFFSENLYAQERVVHDDRDPFRKLTAPAFEDMPVYRLQLRITTGRTGDAGTDDPVFVQMNNRRDSFYLVKGIDNFVEGKTETYDVMLRSVRKVKDIDYIRFAVNGDDGACFKKVELLLNNATSPVFSKTYGGTKGGCFDIGSASATLYIPGSELRASANWRYGLARANMWKPPIKISASWIKSLVEASIGDQIYKEGGDLKWGTHGGTLENNTLFGDAVEISYVNAHTLHVDLDLEVDRAGPNPEMDVDFDMIFLCEDGKIVTEIINAKVETDNIGKVLNLLSYGPRIGSYIFKGIGYIREKAIGSGGVVGALSQIPGGLIGLLAANLQFDAKLDVNNPQMNQGCRLIKVEPNGDITLQ